MGNAGGAIPGNGDVKRKGRRNASSSDEEENVQIAGGVQPQMPMPIHWGARPVPNNPNPKQELAAADNVCIELKEENKPLGKPRKRRPKKTVNNCNIILFQEFLLNGMESGNPPVYTDMTCLPDGRVVIVDYGNNRCSLYDSSYHYMSDLKLSSGPSGICTVDTDEVAVVLPTESKVTFLKIVDIMLPIEQITTRRKCTSVAALSKMELVYAGTTNKEGTYYWGVITRDGQEKACFHIPRGKIKRANVYIALNSSNTRVYLSCCDVRTVYCFGLDGVFHFEYKVKKGKEQGFPLVIRLDTENNVYVVDKHLNIIHCLWPDGKLRKIFNDGIPQQPSAICLQQSCDSFLLVGKDKTAANICCIYKLKTKK